LTIRLYFVTIIKNLFRSRLERGAGKGKAQIPQTKDGKTLRHPKLGTRSPRPRVPPPADAPADAAASPDKEEARHEEPQIRGTKSLSRTSATGTLFIFTARKKKSRQLGGLGYVSPDAAVKRSHFLRAGFGPEGAALLLPGPQGRNFGMVFAGAEGLDNFNGLNLLRERVENLDHVSCCFVVLFHFGYVLFSYYNISEQKAN
jgi:hypothetical protein